MAELFLELFSEEIPARMQARASEDLKRLVTDKLKEAGLAFSAASAYATPRRLALTVDGLPLAQPDVTEEKRGPRVGAPEPAIQGFLKSAGLKSLDQCEKRDTGKGEFWFAVMHREGMPTGFVVLHALFDVLTSFPWPKSMRWWSDTNFVWVRPLRNVLCILSTERGSEVIAVLPGINKPVTYGHRFHDPREIKVAGFADYKVKLRESYVIVDPAERCAAIKEQTDKLAAAGGLTVKPDDALLDEVTGLVEWPVVLMGRIHEQFMDIPPEVLTTSMRVNQKYFSLVDKGGKLAPRFLVVANMETTDKGRAIVAGNERVLRARLSDAKFFWDQDRKVKLEERVPALKDIVFHGKLGTVADKVARMQTLAAELVPYIPGADVDQVRSAALLAKADLTSGMVGEFPELQGIMGRYYAMHEGEKQAVADAIAEHYAPLGPTDRCPTAPISVTVALADKIDSLVGFFAINEKPTGSRDPFALRRGALGVIRLIVENSLRIGLLRIFETAFNLFPIQVRDSVKLEIQETGTGIRVLDEGQVDDSEQTAKAQTLARSLLAFFADRLKVALRDKGVRHDLVSAVFALTRDDDLVRLLTRVDALKEFLESDDGINLLTAYRRANNIVRIEEQKDKVRYVGAVDVARLVDPVEFNAMNANNAVRTSVVESISKNQFTEAMTALAQLRRPVDDFFEKVTVNSDDADLRANRLRLLSEIRATLNRVADFSQIEG